MRHRNSCGELPDRNGATAQRFRSLLLMPLLLIACHVMAQADNTSTLPAVNDAPVVFDDEQFFDDPAVIYGSLARYAVFRKGKAIGHHQLRFVRRDNGLEVEVKSELAVRYLGVPVYRYRYEAVESWQNRQLVGIESRIKDNLKNWRDIDVSIGGRILEITDRGKTRTAPMVRFPSNHWHPGVLTESRVFHTLHGKVHHVKIEDLGSEKLQLQGVDRVGQPRVAVVPVRHYRYTGGFIADVWYDAQRRWVNLQFQADDGSQIEYRCTTCLPVQ